MSHIFGIFTPKIGEDEPNLTSIFFRRVETTNQTSTFWSHSKCCFFPPAKLNWKFWSAFFYHWWYSVVFIVFVLVFCLLPFLLLGLLDSFFFFKSQAQHMEIGNTSINGGFSMAIFRSADGMARSQQISHQILRKVRLIAQNHTECVFWCIN